jgi:type IV pilus assembly protein PilC
METHVAADEASLRAELSRRDLHVFEVKRTGGLLGLRGLVLAGTRKVGRREFILFNQQMVALVKAGLPLLQAIDVVLERMKEGAFRRYLRDVRDRIKSGSSLSEAFQAQGEAFPSMYAASLTAGERSGELATVMARYLAFARKSEHVRGKVTAALIYPALLCVLSLTVVNVLLFYALPKFSAFYTDFGSQLPAYTASVINLVNFCQHHVVIIGLTVIGLVMAVMSWRRTEQGALAMDRIQLRLPVVGKVVRWYNIAQFGRTLSTLLSGGIPLVSALQTATGAMTNREYIAAARTIGEEVRTGRALWDSMERSGVMTDMSVELVKVGESTGALDAMLANIAEFYDEQVDEAITRIVSLFEPIMLIIMGIVVAFLLLAMYLPIFNLSATTNY